MYELFIEDYFSAAHRLKYYRGKCENLHGHNWKVQVLVEAKELNEIGLAIDFKDIKSSLLSLLNVIDHTDLNSNPELKGENPTSENIARWIYEKLSPEMLSKGVKLKKVTVWESLNAAASYYCGGAV